MLDIPAVQKSIRDLGVDGWLLYDFRGLNVLAQRIVFQVRPFCTFRLAVTYAGSSTLTNPI